MFAIMTVLTGSASAATVGHYLFAWAGDADSKGEDFLAVIDADPASPTYGKPMASAASGIRSQQAHHSEYWMPASQLLFANDHEAGKTAIMDIRDPLHPRVHVTFGDLDGFSHPHSFLRLPNGHVLASFQVEGHLNHAGMGAGDMGHEGHEMPPATDIGARPGVHGGLVEIDDEGRAVRSASTADPGRPNDFLMAYSLLPLPDIDRVLVTNSPMRGEDRNGRTYQIFRLSDLKRLSTNDLDPGNGQYGEINPEEARRAPDGSVYIQTLGCGIERVTAIATDRPRSKLVWQFPGSNCGVPTIVSHYLIESVPILHAIVVLDIRQGDRPVEVGRTTINPVIQPHWTVYDPVTRRLAVTGHEEDRLYMLTFDERTGALAIDAAFRDVDGKTGFNFDGKTWPHGWSGSAVPHGVVFSR
nr:hypothetical protein [Polymorphobacter sp.]